MTIDLEALYIDLHQHPELSFQETRTAGIAAEQLRHLGLEVTEGVGITGVVGVLSNGEGPVIWLRADMDALPVEEKTGLAYASTVTGIDPEGTAVPVMHACGHDMHVTAMIGAAERLIQTRNEWSGTVVVIIQPAEEYGTGARAMLDDGMLERFPRPNIVLGQHVTPIAAGTVGMRAGAQMAAADGVSITLHGRGGHGSRPQTTVDPVVMAASTIMRLQTVVSRDIDPREMAVVTVGAVHAGLKNNIIPDEARLAVSMRSANEEVRERLFASVERVVRAEATASGAEREPEFRREFALPVTYNDPASTERLRAAFSRALGEESVVELDMFTGSEDVSWFARDADVPLIYWFFGGVDPEAYRAAVSAGSIDTDIPSNHSPLFAPVIQPTLSTGITALVTAAREFLGSPAVDNS